MPLLGEHARGRFTRPHLRGQRAGGRDWSTRFACELAIRGRRHDLRIELVDKAAGLGLVTEAESLPGGAPAAAAHADQPRPEDLRARGLEVVLPVADHLVEVLDFTGRHERERNPQRHEVTDGLWLRESRAGRPGLGAATMAVLGTPGFSTTYGEVLGVHVAWSGNSVLRVERDAATGTTIGGGELLLPGRGAARPAARATPRRGCTSSAADDGLDGLAAALARPPAQPADPPGAPAGRRSTCWEAVYFDHDLGRLHRDRGPGRLHRGGAVRARRRLVPASGATTPSASATGGSTPRCGPRGSARWSSTCAASACSSGCGSSRRW